MRRSLVIGIVVLVVVAGCTGGPDQSATSQATTTPATTADLTTANTTTQSATGTLEVHFINVGQSVSTLVRSPSGETMLIDTGDFRDDGADVLNYLKRHDVDRIDYLVSSHADADHIGGNAALIEYYETEAEGIGAIYDPGVAASTQTYREYLEAVDRHDVTLYRTQAGDRIPMEDVNVQVLSPPEGYLASEDRNENSIVVRITHGETSFLFTGDAERAAEEYLVETYGQQLQSTVLKAGHHGSRSSTGGALLDTVQPKAVLVSSAYDSQYGHPHEETLQRLAERDIPTYWTGTHGDIVLESDGQTVTVATQRDAPTAPLALRDAEPIAPGSTDSLTVRTRLTGGGAEPITQTTASATTTTQADGGQLAIASVHPDAAGDDRENLNDEYLVLTNTGTETLDMGGWTIEDAAGHTYTIPEGVELPPGETITLHTGSGTDTDTDLYWGASQPIWNNDGDTIRVKTAEGEVVLEETY